MKLNVTHWLLETDWERNELPLNNTAVPVSVWHGGNEKKKKKKKAANKFNHNSTMGR